MLPSKASALSTPEQGIETPSSQTEKTFEKSMRASKNHVVGSSSESPYYYSKITSHKYFTIAQTSMELFSDHPSGKLGIPVLSTAQQTLKSAFSTSCRQIHTLGNDKVLLTHQCGELHYCIIYIREVERKKRGIGTEMESDEYEDEPKETTAALFRQINLLHDLTNFCIVINPFNQHGFNNRTLNQSAIHSILKPIVETMKRLYKSQQSILVQGIEYVDLNHINRASIIDALKKGIQQYSFILHAVLLVGTKLAAIYSRDKTWVLLPRDLLCLIIYNQSTFYNEKPKSKTPTTPKNLSVPPSNQSVSSESSDQFIDQRMMGRNSSVSSDDEDDNKKDIPTIDSRFEYLNFHVTDNQGDYDQKLCRFGVYFEFDKDQDMTLMLICESNIKDIQSKVVAGSVEAKSYQSNASVSASLPNSYIEDQSVDEKDKETIHDQLKEAAIRVNEEISNFKRFSFLKIKADSHVTMLNYLHYCPGLVHFIFVDRVYNRVFAPRIVPLNTTSSNQKSDEEQVAFLKKKVWEMCYTLQQYRDEGYTEIGVCGDGVQYWFKEWLEDEKLLELKMTRNNLKYAKSHFELYTMYLPFVSLQAVSHHNKLLVQLLLDRRDLS
ncbi:hypothetical protein C9374_002651 [Naegleria lovaniensis]|uniref:Uncharacterized protein n=1 Tax=Naegleria lovaniensis TaxID=51637 RepID=A0AA88GSS7_NAELO|nr:uncharacterized protein C9374_002651 [Naegleria lovaniensis]KAG2386205.1 hypothetical protein C9374_002651 [Naegleria lovaniensis]